MTQEEIVDYNKRCAEFLGFKYHEGSEYWTTLLWGGNGFTLRQMRFHLDWNWIMEVVEAIEKLGYESLTGGSEYYYPEKGMRYIQSFIKDDITIYQEAKTKKEAVVQAINQFLIWYNDTRTNY